MLCQHLLSLTGDIQGRPLPKKPKVITKDAQRVALHLVQEHLVRHYEVLSLDLIGNGLAVLSDMGAMYKDKRSASHISPIQAPSVKYVTLFLMF